MLVIVDLVTIFHQTDSPQQDYDDIIKEWESPAICF